MCEVSVSLAEIVIIISIIISSFADKRAACQLVSLIFINRVRLTWMKKYDLDIFSLFVRVMNGGHHAGGVNLCQLFMFYLYSAK